MIALLLIACFGGRPPSQPDATVSAGVRIGTAGERAVYRVCDLDAGVMCFVLRGSNATGIDCVSLAHVAPTTVCR